MAKIFCIRVVLWLAILSVGHGQEEPEITQDILPEIKRAGTSAKLHCTVTRKGDNKVVWFHTGRDEQITEDERVVLEEDHNPVQDGYMKFEIIQSKRPDRDDWVTYSLIIRRLEETDAGYYRCQISFGGTSIIQSKIGELVVLIPPAILATTIHSLTVQEHQDANLTCLATGYPQPRIKWVRPNGKALPRPLNQFSFAGNVLSMKELRKSDRGVYRCIADNDVRPTTHYDVTLYIEFSPIAKAVQTTYGQAQNRLFDITIECRIAGFPLPDLAWYKVVGDGGLAPIKDDDKHNIHILVSHGQLLSISELWYQLNIINVQGNDYGEFKCEGSNKLGRHSAVVEIYETSECQGPNCPAENVKIAGSSIVSASVSLVLTSLIVIWYQGV